MRRLPSTLPVPALLIDNERSVHNMNLLNVLSTIFVSISRTIG